MKMKILHNTLKKILLTVPYAPPETGGILGGKRDIVSVYMIDYGIETINHYDHYFPDLHKINQILNNWEKSGIDFYGIFHTHFPGGDELSRGDKKYITKIMQAMPPEVNKLFFPIILPKEMIGYQAERYDSQIYISRDDIKII